MKQKPECVFYACCGSKCKKNGGKHLYKLMKHEVKTHGLKRHVQVIKTGCTDRCKHGPVVAVMPQNEWHLHVTDERALQLIQQFALSTVQKG